jgi:hypothetical protein
MHKPKVRTLEYYDMDEVLAYLEEKYDVETMEYFHDIFDHVDYEFPTETFIVYEDKQKSYYMSKDFVDKRTKELQILTEELGENFNLSTGD